MKLTTPEEVFLYIAEAYDTPREERDKLQKDITRFGICSAIDDLRGDIVDDNAWDFCDLTIDAYGDDCNECDIEGSCYWHKLDREGDLLRRDDCIFMAVAWRDILGVDND